jgi:tight adherence protein B
MLLIALLFVGFSATVAIVLYLIDGRNSTDTQKVAARLQAIGAGISQKRDLDNLAVRRDEILSEIPWVDKLLRRIDIVRGLSIVLAIVCGYLVSARTGSTFLSLLLAVGGGALPFFYLFHRRGVRFERIKERLPEALDLMVSGIRAGHTFTSAMGMAAKETTGPLKREFRQCFEEQNFGLDMRVAMTNLVNRAPLREMRMIATSILIQKETGGNLAEILEKVAILIREDFRLQRQVRIHTAQGRLTGWILSLLPLILGIGLYLVNPEHMSVLWTKPIGLKLLQGAILMTATGIMIIRKIVAIEI